MRQTFSPGYGSWSGNSINHKITRRDLISKTWVRTPLAETKVIPEDEQLFGDETLGADIKNRCTWKSILMNHHGNAAILTP